MATDLKTAKLEYKAGVVVDPTAKAEVVLPVVVPAHKIALVSGANKGIGLAVAKQLASLADFTVYAGTRDLKTGKAPIEALGKANLHAIQLDVTDDASVKRCVDHILTQHKRLDVLVNNAGVGPAVRKSFLDSTVEEINLCLNTNAWGSLRLIRAVVPSMKVHNYGRIVQVSSGAGGLTEMNGHMLEYRVSKVSMNCITRVTNDELKAYNILINSACPGFVDTDMTRSVKSDRKRTPEAAADGLVWLATLSPDGPRGGFFRNRVVIPW